MPWTLPNKGVGQNDLQSLLFAQYLDALLAGIDGVDCVLAGCACTAQGSPDMTVAVAKGSVLSAGALLPVTAGNVTITTANGSNPRLDLIVVDSSGAKQVRAGTAAAAPVPPTRTANDVVIAMVYVPATDTTISSTQISDLRVLRTQGPILLKKTTTAVAINTDATIRTYFTITLPSGLLLAGKVLRVRCGGNYLANSGTPTFILTIAYGGTTLFADVSLAATAGAGRGGWRLDFDLVHSASNVQNINGFVTMQNTVTGARTNPTTGSAGDILGSQAVANRPVTTPLNGTAGAVDSDAGDRTLTVQWTMNVSNSADEVRMEVATAELL